ncbi:MAG TPA: bifunctional oligoribonuclease/PAP phosphatase NrnA [Thermodesulfovibrionales bacterium]|nr:bifunctional oligoribonuclease/PAP phosphatase NrnA [Thermodesulfovibrionales bacterium]
MIPGELIALIGKEKTFFIATHINPDGDALGSSLALSLALESLGKETALYDRDHIPELYHFLPGHERFSNVLPPGRSPLIILDCNEPERAGLSDGSLPYSVVIDHHETVRDFGDIRWIDPAAPATGMMVYSLIKSLGVRITADMATNLYTAIAVDTGTFRYSNTDSEVLRVSAELVDSGADPGVISVALYESWSDGRFRLLLRVLDTLEVVGDIGISFVTRAMFAETGTTPEDTEHFSNFPRMMKRLTISAFFREVDGGWKVSLRSRGEVDVARIAEMFRGGGHRNAAGYKVAADMKTAKEMLIKAVMSRR